MNSPLSRYIWPWTFSFRDLVGECGVRGMMYRNVDCVVEYDWNGTISGTGSLPEPRSGALAATYTTQIYNMGKT
jgi:hypothetical protein